MDRYQTYETRQAFINQLKEGGNDSWSAFYDRYASLIVNFAMKRGCSRDLAEDVLQETALALFRCIHKFDYQRDKGKFRSFLFKITESKIIDSFRRSQRLTALKDEQLFARRGALADAIESSEPQRIWDQMWEERLLGEAVKDVRKKVKSKTFKCFDKVFLRGESVKETAAELGVSPNLVSQHKHRVLKMIVKSARTIRKLYEGADDGN